MRDTLKHPLFRHGGTTPSPKKYKSIIALIFYPSINSNTFLFLFLINIKLKSFSENYINIKSYYYI